MLGRIAGVFVAGLLALAPAAASAAVVRGGGDDAAGDAPTPGLDLVSVAASYDDAGAISFQLGFAGAPDARLVTAMVGRTQSSGACLPEAAVGGVPGNGGVWVSGDLDGAATLTVSGATIAIAANAPELALGELDCALVTTSRPASEVPGETPVRYDSAGPYALAAPPPTNPPPSAPQPAPTAPQPAPSAPQPSAPTPRAPAAKPTAKLLLPAVRVAKTLPRHRWTTVRLTLRNGGTATARAVKLRIGAARGVTVRPSTVTLKALAGGRAATRAVKLKASAKGAARSRLRLTASARGGLSASGAVTLRFATRGGAPRRAAPRRAARRSAPRRTPARTRPTTPRGAEDPLAGTYFWRFNSRADYAWENHGVAFLGDGWAYRGFPPAGMPTCTAVTAVDDRDGCVRYAYDAKTKALTFGGETGFYRDGTLKIGDDGGWSPLLLPKPGSRWQLELHNQGFSGFCGLITGCTTWHEWLTLRADGQFALSSSTISTLGDPGGSTPFTAAWNYPPDKHGTYAVEARGRIRLSYADGRVVLKTIGIELDRAGRPDPVGTGLLLGETNFYPDDDD